MHHLLQRQIRRYFGDGELSAELTCLIAAIDQTYTQNDKDRELLERSLELSSQELNERYEGLDRQLQINRAAQSDLEKALSLLDATLDATEEGIVVVDLEGRVVKFNEVFARIWDIPRSLLNEGGDKAAVNAALRRVAHPRQFVEETRELLADPLTERVDIVDLRDGRVLERFTRPQVLQDECVGRVWSFRDITDKKAAESRLQLARRVFEVSSQGILITNPTFHLIDVNGSLCEMLGMSRDELLGRHLRDVEDISQGGSFNENFFAKLLSDGEWWGELRTRNNSGDQVVWINFSTVLNEMGDTIHHVGMFSDITRLKDVEQQLQQLAYFDPLTGLPNRRMFKENLDKYVNEVQRSGGRVALLYLDLDRFKFINDSLGHLAGDQLLVGVSERIAAEIRRHDLVSRQGGDEFTVALFDTDDESVIADVAMRIIESLARPFHVKGQEAYIGASVGICMLPQQAQSFEEGLRKADTAMYLAKASGKGRYCFWDKETQAAMEARVMIENDLREAVRSDQLEVHFQPIVDSVTGKPVSVEALLRWLHPKRGLIGPNQFIPIAEETGLVTELENWMIEHCCRSLRDWLKDSVPVVPVSVNVSAQHLSDRRLEQRIVDALAGNAVPPDLLLIEITESTAMDEPMVTVEVLRSLQSLGIRSAIDDFGTGYSSLSYLKQLPADKLKVDRSFIRDLTTDPNDRDISKAIIELAHSLSMQTVAEGVEDREQLEILQDMGCDLVQGWLFAKAMTAEKTAEYLRRNRHGVELQIVESGPPASS